MTACLPWRPRRWTRRASARRVKGRPGGRPGPCDSKPIACESPGPEPPPPRFPTCPRGNQVKDGLRRAGADLISLPSSVSGVLAQRIGLIDLLLRRRGVIRNRWQRVQTSCLPSRSHGNWSQAVATVLACASRFRGFPICHRLPPVATARLHKRSIPVAGIPDEKSDSAPSRSRDTGLTPSV